MQLLHVDRPKDVREAEIPISIDALLEALEQGRHENVQHNMDRIITRLNPLLALLSEEQKRLLLVNT